MDFNICKGKSYSDDDVIFELPCRYMPLTFLLGFYIAAIVKRWWDQFELIAWPEDLLRYLNLAAAMSWRDLSKKVRKRFPTMDHLVQVGLMTEEEHEMCNSIWGGSEMNTTMNWLLPIQWTQKIVEGIVKQKGTPPALTSAFFNHLCLFRASFRKLHCYDWVCIPLVYTQVAALATYGYFAFCLIGHQFLDLSDDEKASVDRVYRVDMVVPVSTILQFLFYVGWFKVGQDLMRPFGTDDDDFEMNYILDRHIQTSFSLADQVSMQEPSIVPDKFWRPTVEPRAVYRLPHTKLSSKIEERQPKVHAYFDLKKAKDAEFLPLTTGFVTNLKKNGI